MTASKLTTSYAAFSNISVLQNQGTGFNNVVNSIGVQSDGSIIAGGQFTSLNGTTRNRLVKLSKSGVVDTSFYSALGTNAVNNIIYAVAVQSNDAIVVGGAFTSIGGTTRNRISRISSTGTVDASFYTAIGTGGANGTVRALAIQPSDQYILVGGDFTSIGGTAPDRLARLTTTGSKDSGFQTNLGTGFNAIVYTIAVQADGKILVGGNFTSLNGTTRNRLVRLNSDGTVDTSFYTNLGTGFNANVLTIAVQADGKILVGGEFTTFNTNARQGLVRLNSDGTEDGSFYTNYDAIPPPYPYVGSILENPVDNSIILGFYVLSGTILTGYVLTSSGTFLKTLTNSYSVGCLTYSNGSLYTFFTDTSSYFYIQNLFINGATWTAPAGVTSVSITPIDNTSIVAKGNGKLLEVTPNTSYTVTINSSTNVANNSNTFGSLYTWTGTGAVEIKWVE